MERAKGLRGGPGLRARLGGMLCAAAGLQVCALVALRGHTAALNLMIAGAPLAASGCVLWRSAQVERSERSAWYWIGAALLTWAAAQLCDLDAASLANHGTPEWADYLFYVAAIPLLLAVSSTPATKAVGSIRALNAFQAVLASGLIYVRLFRMPVSAATGGVGALYDAEFVVLAVAVLLRYLSSSTAEDRRCMGLLAAFLGIYMPLEAMLDFAGGRWGLRMGTPLDLAYTLPFLFLGWQALRMPVGADAGGSAASEEGKKGGHWKLLLQGLCPAIFPCGVFALGVSIARSHFEFACWVMLLSLATQGLHSGIVQVRYAVGRNRLLRQEEELKAANAGLEHLSFVDHVTGISNRRHFMEALERESGRAIRRQEWLAILMIDIDHFKGVNDLHGHKYGDECLVRVAEMLRANLRRLGDLAARYGGEEFIVMLPETGIEGARHVAERMQRALEALALGNDASPFEGRLTASIGIAAARPGLIGEGAVLIDLADQALYQAKGRGRNQICESELPGEQMGSWGLAETDLQGTDLRVTEVS